MQEPGGRTNSFFGSGWSVACWALLKREDMICSMTSKGACCDKPPVAETWRLGMNLETHSSVPQKSSEWKRIRFLHGWGRTQ